MLLFLVLCPEKRDTVSHPPSQGLSAMLLAFHSMLVSTPYVQYVKFQLYFEFGRLMKNHIEADFVKYFMRMENMPLFQNIMKGTVFVGVLIGFAVMPMLRKYNPVGLCVVVAVLLGISNFYGIRYSGEELISSAFLYAHLISSATLLIVFQASAPRLLAQVISIGHPSFPCAHERMLTGVPRSGNRL